MATHSLPEVLHAIQTRFKMDDTVEATNSLRKKVESVCKNKIQVQQGDKVVPLWKKACKGGKGKGKPRYLFTDYELQRILDCPEIWTYANTRQKDTSEETLAAVNEAERRNQLSARAEMTEEEFDEYDHQRFIQAISDEEGMMFEVHQEFCQIKFELMVKAIYSIFFEPIDDRKLLEDLKAQNAPRAADGVTRLFTSESILAEKRLKDPKNYCKRKEQPKAEQPKA